MGVDTPQKTTERIEIEITGFFFYQVNKHLFRFC